MERAGAPPTATVKQKDCLNLAHEARLRDGIGIPLRGLCGSLARIGAARSSGGVELNPDMLGHINLMVEQFYSTFLRLVRKPQAIVVQWLSTRERDISPSAPVT